MYKPLMKKLGHSKMFKNRMALFVNPMFYIVSQQIIGYIKKKICIYFFIAKHLKCDGAKQQKLQIWSYGEI